jgi:hypothetical protein
MNNLPTRERREQLARALRPQNIDENALIDYLAAVVREQHPTLIGMLERRTRTAARAGRMHVAQLALEHWLPEPVAPPDAYDVMEDYAAGTVPEPYEDSATAIGLAYDRGWNEAVTYCREQQERGLDPELWSVEPLR